MPRMEHLQFFKNAPIKRLSLPSYPRDTHKLHELNLVNARFYESKVARDVKRYAERNQAGGETASGAVSSSRRREKVSEIGRTLGVKGESRGTNSEPCLCYAFGVYAHKVYLVCNAFKMREHFASFNHVVQLLRLAPHHILFIAGGKGARCSRKKHSN